MKGRWETVSTYLLKKEAYKQALKYLVISLALLFATIIYENFSHGINSIYMRITCLFPFIGGTLLTLILTNQHKPNKLSISLWRMGLSTLVVGSFLLGVFEIYGSIETFVYIYFYVGGVLSILSIIIYIIYLLKRKTNREDIS